MFNRDEDGRYSIVSYTSKGSSLRSYFVSCKNLKAAIKEAIDTAPSSISSYTSYIAIKKLETIRDIKKRVIIEADETKYPTNLTDGW